MGKVVSRIVLTGGPSAGKSSSLDLIRKYLTNKGYVVLVINESATELINSGIKPFGDNKISMIDFQEIILKYQLKKEEVIENVTNIYDREIIIIYDRGIIDFKAYIGDYEFAKLLNKYKLDEEKLLNKYNYVISLETGAKSNYYITDNNNARSESIEEAVELDNKIIEAWKNHKNLFRIECYENFVDKQNKIIEILDIIIK